MSRRVSCTPWSRHHGLALLVAASIALVCRPARASEVFPSTAGLSGWYLPVGMNLGYGIHPQASNGVLLGAEASLVHFRKNDADAKGIYIDYLYDMGASTHRISLGPEIGRWLVGIDGGPVFEFGKQDVRFGARLRGYVSCGILAGYAGPVVLFGGEGEHYLFELGILAKMPFQITTCRDCE